jgi:nicotinate-nucleotide adenylyltransferase
MNIAIFGSAFNPPTKGHEDAVRYLLDNKHNFDSVLLVPSYRHAFGKSMLSYDIRKSFLNAFIDDINDNRVQALAIEDLIDSKEKPIYTYDLLNYLQENLYPNDKLTFVIGPDNKINWKKFYKADEIAGKWDVSVVPERLPIRSTLVRHNLEKGKNIDDLVTPSVARYIEENQLYAR